MKRSDGSGKVSLRYRVLDTQIKRTHRVTTVRADMHDDDADDDDTGGADDGGDGRGEGCEGGGSDSGGSGGSGDNYITK